MSTWQIVADAGDGGFRWEVAGRIIKTDPDDNSATHLDSSSALPSMADLLLQGCSKFVEEEVGATDLPMFTTGSGKSVGLKQSSIAKALAILGDDNACHSGEAYLKENGSGVPNTIFQTGSRKSVNISSAGMLRAKALLGLEEDGLTLFTSAKKPSLPDEQYGEKGFSRMEMLRRGDDRRNVAAASPDSHLPTLLGNELKNKTDLAEIQPEFFGSASKVPPIKFQTAGGRSLSVSTDALKRAKSLLGDLEDGSDEEDANDSFSTPLQNRYFDSTPSTKGNDSCISFSHKEGVDGKTTPNTFMCPLISSSKQLRSLVNLENLSLGNNLINKFEAVVDQSDRKWVNHRSATHKPISVMPPAASPTSSNISANAYRSRDIEVGRLPRGPLAEITNCGRASSVDGKQKITLEKRRLGLTSSASPFKRPRNSKFTPPLCTSFQHAPRVLSAVSSEQSSKRPVSTRYPSKVPRLYVKEYFGGLVSAQIKLENLPDQVRQIRSDNATNFVFTDEFGLNTIGVEAFFHMVLRAGTSTQYASKEWVANHYRWIVWKLASYERLCSAKYAGKFLTVSNVLEELKYRYEREVNHGQRSAIKRILAGDAQSSSMMVLCISAIRATYGKTKRVPFRSIQRFGSSDNMKVEVSDGWYAMDATLDLPLSRQLIAGKLFVGQKLRVWGAGLCGWMGPTSPLEVSGTVSLFFNINGTYRAHWADRLGFCKKIGMPLAFNSIKSNGGPVPRTLVGITRIYPIVYKERLANGRSVVRSERMENEIVQWHSHRRSVLVEGIVSEYDTGVNSIHMNNQDDSEEGAKLFKLLETAAEPEVLMAEMSPQQLASFATYKEKLEVARQTDMKKLIEKALEDATLGNRDVTPFMRVRVVGLTAKNSCTKRRTKEGIVTIWNPTEKQKNELAEGQLYAIEGLSPVNSDSGTLYMQAKGSTAKWLRLSRKAAENFQPFFNPRKSVQLSNMGQVPISSEFDIAALVVHVGEVYVDSMQKKQWVFVTDWSISKFELGTLSNSILAISFCSPYLDNDAFPQINQNLAGSTVGFCNLIKRAKDQANNLWVAEATENSTYFLNFDAECCSHLRATAANVRTWAETSRSIIDELKEKILFILGDR